MAFDLVLPLSPKPILADTILLDLERHYFTFDMPRKLKYTTEEERLAARARYNEKYYDKFVLFLPSLERLRLIISTRNHRKILSKRRKRYELAKKKGDAAGKGGAKSQRCVISS